MTVSGAAMTEERQQHEAAQTQSAAPVAVRCRRTGEVLGYVTNPWAVDRLAEILRQHGFEVVTDGSKTDAQ